MKTKPTVEIDDLIGEHCFPPMTRFNSILITGLVMFATAVVVFGAIRSFVPLAPVLFLVLIAYAVCLTSVADDLHSRYIVSSASFSKRSPIRPLGWVIPADDIRVVEVEEHWTRIRFLIRCHSGQMKTFLPPPSMAKAASDEYSVEDEQ